MELGSIEEAQELVQFHKKHLPTVNGEQIEISISHTFNFVQVDILLCGFHCARVRALNVDSLTHCD